MPLEQEPIQAETEEDFLAQLSQATELNDSDPRLAGMVFCLTHRAGPHCISGEDCVSADYDVDHEDPEQLPTYVKEMAQVFQIADLSVFM